jgi:4-aminobutyrate aminotransferase-like enzyme
VVRGRRIVMVRNEPALRQEGAIMDASTGGGRFDVLPRVVTALPGPISARLFADADAVLCGPMRDHVDVPFVEARKSDWVIEDVDGNTFVDLVSAWGSTPLGAHPAATGVAAEALDRYGMEITDYVFNEPALALARRLVEIAPAGISRVGPSISGTEAVEAGVKLAREATGRPMILGFHGQYHGESTYLTAAASTDLSEVTSNAAQYVSGMVFAPYPNRFRAPFHKGPGPYDDTLYADFIEEYLLVHQVDPEQVAGVLIEPVLGEGGILVPSAQFWRRLTELCRRYGWKLILDEVQTCLGRCGTMFAAELWDLEPDIVLMGKGIAAGCQPIAAVLATDAVMADSDVQPGGTFAWTPAACAGALAGIEAIIAEGALQNARALADVAHEELDPLVELHEQVGDVRVVGAWVGVEFVTDKRSITPAPAFHAAVHQKLVRRGVLGITQWGKWVYRMQPAINMPPDLFRWACRQAVEAIAEVAAHPPAEPGLLARFDDGVRRRTG